MSQERLLNTLLAPHVSEKSAMPDGQYSKYVFKVDRNATKPQIREAVEKLFNVKVRTVRVSNVKSKVKRFRKTVGKQAAWKKAIVSLEHGQEIGLE